MGKEAHGRLPRSQSTSRDADVRDARLIRLCKAGLAEGFEGLYSAYSHRVYATAVRILLDRHQAEDVTQDVFLKVFRKIHTFRAEEAKFSTWLYRVVVNSCTDRLRTRAKRTVAGLDSTLSAELVIPDGRTPLGEAERKELQQKIEAALEDIEDEQRTILVLRVIEDLSYAEIAEVMDLSTSQVRGRLHRARKAFIQNFGIRG